MRAGTRWAGAGVVLEWRLKIKPARTGTGMTATTNVIRSKRNPFIGRLRWSSGRRLAFRSRPKEGRSGFRKMDRQADRGPASKSDPDVRNAPPAPRCLRYTL